MENFGERFRGAQTIISLASRRKRDNMEVVLKVVNAYFTWIILDSPLLSFYLWLFLLAFFLMPYSFVRPWRATKN